MSSDQTGSLPGSLPLPLAQHYSAFITPAINFLMIGATMGAALVTMLLALLFFSTPSMARKPVFILNVIAVLLGIANAIVNIYEEIRTLKYPTTVLNPHVIIAMGSLNGLTPIFVDGILLLRLHAVFPPERTSRVKYAMVMAFPVLNKIGRLINAAIFLDNYQRNLYALISPDTGAGGAAVLLTSRLPSVRIEWFLQVFDDLYSSGIFLYQMYRQGSFNGRARTASQKIRTLFWICTSNFVFPVMLGITQLTIYMMSAEQYLLALYVEEVNLHFTIMGVVFATVWAAEGRWAALHNVNDPSDPEKHLSSVVNFTVPGGAEERAIKTRSIAFAPVRSISTIQSGSTVSSTDSQLIFAPTAESTGDLQGTSRKEGKLDA
ncbi:hypothetical protein BV25DRAFT_757945 [Artomyces pyxidatus]|uniref:Uncharacterized protein n=1 Tax=Artomyces pyxidatus TaxID=48021 RepID=A0ACB8T0D8_9AGAM|nr:hypothetical protein BV25DRAFT_757945 [Artomyces pyxidatus]